MLLLDADMLISRGSIVISTGLLGLNLLVMIGMVRSAVVGINQALQHAKGQWSTLGKLTTVAESVNQIRCTGQYQDSCLKIGFMARHRPFPAGECPVGRNATACAGITLQVMCEHASLRTQVGDTATAV